MLDLKRASIATLVDLFSRLASAEAYQESGKGKPLRRESTAAQKEGGKVGAKDFRPYLKV